MNKEEILTELNKLKDNLPKYGVDDTALESQASEIETLAQTRNDLTEQIRDLEVKLADDSNYPNNTLLYNEGRRFNIEDSINESNRYLLDNKAKATSVQGEIDFAQIELDYTNKKIDSKEREILEVGRNMRSNTNVTPEQDAQFQSELAFKRDELATLRNRSTELGTLISTKETDLTNLNNVIDGLEKEVAQHQQELSDFDDSIKDETFVNEVARDADKNKLEQLKTALDTCNARDEFLSYDFAKELNQMITGVNDGTLTPDAVSSRLKEYQAHLPEEFLNRNEDEKNAELEKIAKADSEMSSEIAALQDKLGNEENYTPSIFAAERNNDRLTSIMASVNSASSVIAESDVEIAGYTRDISRIDREISFSKEYISRLQDEIVEWGVDLRRLRSDADQTLVDSLVTKIKVNRDEISKETENIATLQREQEIIRTQINASQERKTLSKSKQERYQTVADSLRASLEDRNSVDRFSMKLDQDKLAQLLAARNAMNNRKSILEFNISEEITTLSSKLEGQEVVEAPVVDENEAEVVEPQQSDDFASVFAGLKDEDKSKVSVEPIAEIHEFGIDSDNKIVMNNGETTNANGEKVVGGIFDKDGNKTGDLIEGDNFEYFAQDDKGNVSNKLIPYTGPVKVASFTAPSDELKEDAKNKKVLDRLKDLLKNLKEDWKKNWKKYVAVFGIALVVGISTKACSFSKEAPSVDAPSASSSQEKDADKSLPSKLPEFETEELIPDASLVAGNTGKTHGNSSSNKTHNNTSSSTLSAGTGDINISGEQDLSGKVTGGQVIGEHDEVVSDVVNTNPTNTPEPTHEDPIDPEAGNGAKPGDPEQVVIGGGEQIGGTVDTPVEEPTPAPTENPSQENPTQPGTTDETVDDNVVLPDLGGGVLANSTPLSNAEITERVTGVESAAESPEALSDGEIYEQVVPEEVNTEEATDITAMVNDILGEANVDQNEQSNSLGGR